MAQKTINNKPDKYVLVFNHLKHFIAVFRSCTATAKIFNTSPTNIQRACTGDSISARNHYFRYCDKDKCNLNELGNMSVIDWDKKNGLERNYYSNGQMSRLGMKYKKTIKKIAAEHEVNGKKFKAHERITREMILERIWGYKRTK